MSLQSPPTLQPEPTVPERARESGVYLGRYTADVSAPFVVFLIGMRFNTLRGLPVALRTFFSMPKILGELAADPSLGLLEQRVRFSWRSVELIQYWRSFEELERYARGPEHEHVGAWRWFNGLRDKATGVGIWHETYLVDPGKCESIYANMPRFGLAAAAIHAPLAGASGARARVTGEAAA